MRIRNAYHFNDAHVCAYSSDLLLSNLPAAAVLLHAHAKGSRSVKLPAEFYGRDLQ